MTDESAPSDSDLREIAQSWGLTASGALDASALLEILAAKVDDMLRHDRRKFMNAIYRLDVSEERVAHVLRAAPAHDQARLIAELILRRELQKAATRRAAQNQ